VEQLGAGQLDDSGNAAAQMAVLELKRFHISPQRGDFVAQLQEVIG
jgi:hypothetical protein